MPPLAGFLLRRSSATDWLPVIAALATFCWAYYAYVHVFCPALVKDDVERFSLVSLFLLLLSLALWSFLRAITASIPPVPKRYYVSPGTRSLIEDSKTFEERKELMEALSATRGILTRANDGSVRYCDKCGLVKPDRCHHCSSCKRCIPKMDHHCPWLNNCVCFSSYKFFLLTLLYVALLAVFTFVTTSSYAWDAASTLELTAASLVHIGFLAVLGGALTLLLAGFFSVHMRLVYKNETTLEGMRADTFAEPGDSFDIGSFKNFTQVFGTSVFLWPFPVFTSLGDGVRFPTRLHPDPDSVAEMELGLRRHQLSSSILGKDVRVDLASRETTIAEHAPAWGTPSQVPVSVRVQPSSASLSPDHEDASAVQCVKAATTLVLPTYKPRPFLRLAATAKQGPLVHPAKEIPSKEITSALKRSKTSWYLASYAPSGSDGCVYDL